MLSRKLLEKGPLLSIFDPLRTLGRIIAHATNPDLKEHLDELNRSWGSPSMPCTSAISTDDRTATPSHPETFPSSPTDSGIESNTDACFDAYSDASSDCAVTPEREHESTVRTPHHFRRQIRETGPLKRPREIDSHSTTQSMGTESRRMPPSAEPDVLTAETCDSRTSIGYKK